MLRGARVLAGFLFGFLLTEWRKESLTHSFGLWFQVFVIFSKHCSVLTCEMDAMLCVGGSWVLLFAPGIFSGQRPGARQLDVGEAC